MNNSVRAMLLTFLSFSLLAGAGSVYAEMDKHPGKDLFKRLDLTVDQKSKIEALKSDNEKSVIQMRADVQIARIDLRTEMNKDTLDLAKIGQLADTISSDTAKITKAEIMLRAQIMNILTKDQRAKLEQLREGREHPDKEKHEGEDKEKGGK